MGCTMSRPAPLLFLLPIAAAIWLSWRHYRNARALLQECAAANRLRILHAICQSEQSVSAIVAATGATQTNVSRHLALLLRAGVVGRRREGTTVYYSIADPEFVTICRSVCVRIAGRIDAALPLRRDLKTIGVIGPKSTFVPKLPFETLTPYSVTGPASTLPPDCFE